MVYVWRHIFGTSELFVIRADLISHPTQIFYRFPLARIEALDQLFSHPLPLLAQPAHLATLNNTAVEMACGHKRQIAHLQGSSHCEGHPVLGVGGDCRKTYHRPNIKR